MEFARKQLEKYGWTEGMGLGRNQNGITKIVKPNLKFDKAGLGHDISEEFNNPWWERLYNEAASNIFTREENDVITVDTKGEAIEITAKKRKRKYKNEHMISLDGEYKGFIRTSELKDNNEANHYIDILDSDEDIFTSKKKNDLTVADLTNEELLQICGGRTIHKGARHGLKMNAKLARLEEHEKNSMKSLQNYNKISENHSWRTSAKIDKPRKSTISDDTLFVGSTDESFIKKKKNKTKKKAE